MNEKIKELAKEAGFNQMGIWNIIGIDEYNERFAELIVRESAGVVNYYHSRNEPVTSQQILRHFGIE